MAYQVDLTDVSDSSKGEAGDSLDWVPAEGDLLDITDPLYTSQFRLAAQINKSANKVSALATSNSLREIKLGPNFHLNTTKHRRSGWLV